MKEIGKRYQENIKEIKSEKNKIPRSFKENLRKFRKNVNTTNLLVFYGNILKTFFFGRGREVGI